MKVVWMINVYDRPVDLRVNLRMIRQDLGHEVDVVTLCNADGDPNIYKNIGEDQFFHYQNRNHLHGTLDAYEHGKKFLEGYDYVVSQHAKCWVTKPRHVLDLTIPRMLAEKKSVAFFATANRGACFQPRQGMNGEYLDLFVVDAGLYSKTDFVLNYDFNAPNSHFIETLVPSSFMKATGLSQEKLISKVPCLPPMTSALNRQVDHRAFYDIHDDPRSAALAFYDIPKKTKILQKMRDDAGLITEGL